MEYNADRPEATFILAYNVSGQVFVELAMTARFTAIVEQGQLRPMIPLGLPDGSSVEVVIVAPDPPGATEQSPAEILAAIAAMSSVPVDPSTSARHDDVLNSPEARPVG
jgi:hypothetical protein